MLALITQAANVWNSAGANVQLVTTGTATININSFSIPFLPLPGFSSPYNTTGVLGNYPDGTPFRQILNATMAVNSGLPTWYFGPGTAPPGQFDFLAFMIQEFGHALGLGFVNDPTSVMNVGPFGLFQPGAAIQAPSAADIAALQILYGAPEPETWALFGVGLVALGALKKSRRSVRPAL
jgi:hypothetical protein